ncbi:MAG: hypothetical protein US98_C0053G0010 [Parcubacteria group bacterium GW2011_GWC1_38_6]|nr:MAG: hypothetical protein US98_C0053G0010 [Parcubacteria group bacterium GW2011_GWC1_38_6]
MKNRARVIIYAIIIVILVVVVVITIRFRVKEDISVITNNKSYGVGDTLRVKISNNLFKQISFSLCYPYFLERKNGSWEVYDYIDCKEFNGSDYKINPLRNKSFELILPNVPEGIHRLRIPICIGCKDGENFKADMIFYSNEFQIGS